VVSQVVESIPLLLKSLTLVALLALVVPTAAAWHDGAEAMVRDSVAVAVEAACAQQPCDADLVAFIVAPEAATRASGTALDAEVNATYGATCGTGCLADTPLALADGPARVLSAPVTFGLTVMDLMARNACQRETYFLMNIGCAVDGHYGVGTAQACDEGPLGEAVLVYVRDSEACAPGHGAYTNARAIYTTWLYEEPDGDGGGETA